MQDDDVDKSPVKEMTPDLQVPEGPLPLVQEDDRAEPKKTGVTDAEISSKSDAETPVQSPRRSSRVLRPPGWLQNYMPLVPKELRGGCGCQLVTMAMNGE